MNSILFTNLSKYHKKIYFISLLAFFVLWSYPSFPLYLLFIPNAILTYLITKKIKPEVNKYTKLSLFTSIGILCANQYYIFQYNKVSTTEKYIRYLLLILSIYSLCFLLNVFYTKFAPIIQDIINNIDKKERIVYIIIISILTIITIICFSKSAIYYTNEYKYDYIYTSDSGNIVGLNAYSSLVHVENDIRQPLFAVFAAPLVGIFQFIGAFFPETIKAILLNISQIILLVISNGLLGKCLNLKNKEQIRFVLLTSVTYTTLLFSLMMEQYIVIYFYTILTIYCIIQNKNSTSIAFAATGTLITNGILIPNTLYNRNKKIWIKKTFKTICYYVTIVLASRNVLFIANDSNSTSILATFFSFNPADNIKQYSTFISNLFIAPNVTKTYVTDSATETTTHLAWQLSKPEYNILGFILLTIAIALIVKNRGELFTRISGYWIIFGIIIMTLFGWGTYENGLILYSLYFGWPFFTTLFKPISKSSIATFITIGVSLYFNIPGIYNLANFATQYYPL